jgi:Protein of unknown function (DUF3445)
MVFAFVLHKFHPNILSFISHILHARHRVPHPVSPTSPRNAEDIIVLPFKETELDCITPRPPPIFQSPKFRLTMGLKRHPFQDWLQVDRNFLIEHAYRTQLLQNVGPEVVMALPDAKEACKETLELVTGFLLQRYPSIYSTRLDRDGNETITVSLDGGKTISNSYRKDLRGHEGRRFLEVAASLALEDFNVLQKGPDGHYHL